MTGDPATPAATKAEIRTEARDLLSRMTAEQRREADRDICRSVLRFALDRRAKWVLGYLALRDEVRVDALLAELLARGVEIWLPRASQRRLWIGRWRPAMRLIRDDEGVWAPAERLQKEWPQGVGLVLAPGRAFDVSGGRVGRGRGYFDRLLAHRTSGAVVIGMAYGCQIVQQVPRELHDRDVDVVVTERATWLAAGSGAAQDPEERKQR